jgi:hypothetical protein
MYILEEILVALTFVGVLPFEAVDVVLGKLL